MPAVVTIYDESPTGRELQAVKLTLVSERLTARELIEGRVRQEVERFNAAQPDTFQSLVTPNKAEQILNDQRQRKPRLISPDNQVAKAMDAFKNNGFFILVNNRQIESLDEPILFTPDTRVSFVKLVPLVGG